MSAFSEPGEGTAPSSIDGVDVVDVSSGVSPSSVGEYEGVSDSSSEGSAGRTALDGIKSASKAFGEAIKFVTGAGSIRKVVDRVTAKDDMQSDVLAAGRAIRSGSIMMMQAERLHRARRADLMDLGLSRAEAELASRNYIPEMMRPREGPVASMREQLEKLVGPERAAEIAKGMAPIDGGAALDGWTGEPGGPLPGAPSRSAELEKRFPGSGFGAYAEAALRPHREIVSPSKGPTTGPSPQAIVAYSASRGGVGR